MGEPPPMPGGAGWLLASLLPEGMRENERAIAACLWAGMVGDGVRALAAGGLTPSAPSSPPVTMSDAAQPGTISRQTFHASAG